MSTADGMNYAPKGKPAPVCQEGDFVFAAVGLDHGHIYGMCNGLTEAGGRLKWAYDPDPAKTAALAASFPGVQVARSEGEVLEDPGVQLVAGAAVPADHAALGMRVMAHGKDYFTDKPALTTLDQLAQARLAVESTGRKYAVYYSERVHVESAVLAGQLVHEGALGRVLQVIGHGPAPRQPGVAAPMVLRAGTLRGHPVRPREPPGRTVPLVHGQFRRPGGRQPGRQLRPQGPARPGGFR